MSTKSFSEEGVDPDWDARAASGSDTSFVDPPKDAKQRMTCASAPTAADSSPTAQRASQVTVASSRLAPVQAPASFDSIKVQAPLAAGMTGSGYIETANILMDLRNAKFPDGPHTDSACPTEPVETDFEAAKLPPVPVASSSNLKSRKREAACVSAEDTGSESDYESGAKKRRGNLPKAATSKFKEWLFNHLQHPYPSEEEKVELSTLTKLSVGQISNWFINARRRILQPMMDQAKQLHSAGDSGDSVIVGLQKINGIPNVVTAVRSLTDSGLKISQIQRVGQMQAVTMTPSFKISSLTHNTAVMKELQSVQQENLNLKMQIQKMEMMAQQQQFREQIAHQALQFQGLAGLQSLPPGMLPLGALHNPLAMLQFQMASPPGTLAQVPSTAVTTLTSAVTADSEHERQAAVDLPTSSVMNTCLPVAKTLDSDAAAVETVQQPSN